MSCPQGVAGVTPGTRRDRYPAVTNFTIMLAAVHSDTPLSPEVVHSVIHSGVLTGQDAGPSFARQESPGLRVARRFWGRWANGPQRSQREVVARFRCPGSPACAAWDSCGIRGCQAVICEY